MLLLQGDGMKELPIRKTNRLKGYNYSQKGAYFITMCAKDRTELFGYIVGAVVNRPRYIELQLGFSPWQIFCIAILLELVYNVRKRK